MTIMIPAWFDGTLTPVEKLEVHQRGLKHKAVSVFVTRGDEILLQQRALCKYHTPGLWTNTCCTHPEWDEDPLACANRRLNEELGIKGLQPVHRELLEYRADVGGGLTEHEVVDVYTAEAGPDLVVAPNPDEVMAIQWITMPALREAVAQHPTRYTPWFKIYLDQYSATIFGADASVL
jgi:isopentenyl-diphosphate delta-isomerase